MALTKKSLVSKFGFTNYKKELLKYVTPEVLLVVRKNILYISPIGGEEGDDRIIAVIDNFTETEFANYLSKTINGYVKRYKARMNGVEIKKKSMNEDK